MTHQRSWGSTWRVSLKVSTSCLPVLQSLGLSEFLRRSFSALACAFCLAASSLAAWLLGIDTLPTRLVDGLRGILAVSRRWPYFGMVSVYVPRGAAGILLVKLIRCP